MVETLTSKTRAWENERGTQFLYDGVQLLSMLEDYSILRQEKEKERQRQRDQRKLQGRILTEQETLFGSKPSPTKSSKKAPRYSSVGGAAAAANKRFSLGGSFLQKQGFKPDRSALHSHPIKLGHIHQNGGKKNTATSGPAQKKQPKTTNPRDDGSTKSRNPFSPLSGTLSSPVNPKNTPEKQGMVTPKAHSASRTPRSTPTKSKSDEVCENVAALKKLTSPVPVTPSMLSARSASPYTPASVKVGEVVNGGNFGYSFEEIRAGFVLPERTVNSPLQF